MSKYGAGFVYLRGKVWWIRYSRGGRRVSESSHSTFRMDAERLLRDRTKPRPLLLDPGRPAEQRTECPHCHQVVTIPHPNGLLVTPRAS